MGYERFLEFQWTPGYTFLSLVLTIISIVAMWKIFEKAKEPGWTSIVPIYNLYVLFKIVWGKGWYFLLLLIPIVNIVIAIMHVFKLAKCFGKSTGFGFGLLFLPFIFTLILAFGNDKYLGPSI